MLQACTSLRRRPPLPCPLRVVTWNLNHWQQPLLPTDTRGAAWRHLRDIGAQVALVQEAVPPADLEPHHVVYGELAGFRNWGSAVAALDPTLRLEPLRSVRIPWLRRRYPLATAHPGAVAVARLHLPGIEPITLVSVYGVFDGPVVGTMLRLVGDLVPLFDSAHGARVILAGDLHISRATADALQLERAEAILAAIRSLGLVEAKTLLPQPLEGPADCPCTRAGCDHVATWRTAELDHVFVSPALADQVVGLAPDRAAVEAGLSDHVPLVLDLALSPERTAHAWDEDAFAEEIGRRHGLAARSVVEALVNWAEHAERRLAAEAGVAAKTLTRFPTNGRTTEPELGFPVDLNLVPKGVQPRISIRASGEVVVHFGGMRHPPFDTDEGRAGLLAQLNGIEGIDLPPSAIKGWPRFPIAVLERPEALAGLVAVLGRIAVETEQLTGSIPVRTSAESDRKMRDNELVAGGERR